MSDGSRSKVISLLNERIFNVCNKGRIQTLIMSSCIRIPMERILGQFPNLKEWTFTGDISHLYLPPWCNRIPALDESFTKHTWFEGYDDQQLEVINVFELVQYDKDTAQERQPTGNKSNSASLRRKVALEKEKIKIFFFGVLNCFPKLRQLNLYNTTVSKRLVEQCWNEIRELVRRKNDVVTKMRSGNVQDAQNVIQSVEDYNWLAMSPLVMNDNLKLELFPCILQPNMSLVFESLMRCGLSPRSFVEDNRTNSRSYLFIVLHHGVWDTRKGYLEELYNKYPNEFFSWFQEKDWHLLLLETTCTHGEFMNFFLPKFTKYEFMRIMSPSILTVVGDKAYPVIQQMPNFGFDFKWIPRLLDSVENMPLLYKLFCDHGCSLKGQKVIPHHYLKSSTRVYVLHKVLEEFSDLSSSSEFKDHIFTILGAKDEHLALLALNKIGHMNVRSHLDKDGNTYLHVALKEESLELARTIIRRYGVDDVNQMNHNKESILHIACRSLRCIPNLIELLLDMPGIETNIKNEAGETAYDIVLKTLSSTGYPSSMCTEILLKLLPETPLSE